MLRLTPAILQASNFPESSDDRPAIHLNARWRVIVCRDGVQWVLQFRNRRSDQETVARDDWRGRSYCRTRDALIRCCDAYCGPIDPVALATLEALPEWIEATAIMREIKAAIDAKPKPSTMETCK
jgi:hypothetical protein